MLVNGRAVESVICFKHGGVWVRCPYAIKDLLWVNKMTNDQSEEIAHLIGSEIIDIQSAEDKFILTLSRGLRIEFSGEGSYSYVGRAVITLPCGTDILAD